ncbi:MAG: T9SS type A sorting domain-containing protein [Chitinophagales bacterium]|nr:T9SS type A sorting domain-containing protein [Bacteroidota bacterium]MBP9705471.1 T9SS type A sorting domain-containing protein [Chitinophagales bacterium]
MHYLKSTTTMASLNNNLAPSVFIDFLGPNPTLYVFYTNVTDQNQWFGIDPGSLQLAFTDPSESNLYLSENISAKILNADQLYSTAGKASIFNINNSYSTCASAIMEENRFEINALENNYPNTSCPGTFSGLAPDGVCLEMPPISMGYFSIPIYFLELKSGYIDNQLKIYPNPATDYIYLKQGKDFNEEMLIEINIYSMYGSLIKSIISEESTTLINISELSIGVYIVEVKTEGQVVKTETLVKID